MQTMLNTVYSCRLTENDSRKFNFKIVHC